MIKHLVANERLKTIILVLAIGLLGIKILQVSLPKSPPPTIAFTCAVAVHSLTGELCVKGPSGASVNIEVRYCDGRQINSPHLHDQVNGEYRWIWNVNTSCRGPASAKATAYWSGNRSAEALATFDVA